MGKYIKLFETHAAYNTYITGNDKVLPNVSYCENENEVHYNIWYDPERFVAKFNVTSTTSATSLFNNPSLLKELEIDGVIYTGNDIFSHYNHTFSTTGIHTVKYTLNDNVTSISGSSFASKSNMVSITIPNTITTITNGAFQNCTGLKSIIIPDSITSIGNGVFGGCTSLKTITIPSSVTTIEGNLGDFDFEDVIFEPINPNATFVRDTTNKILTNIAGDTLICGFNNTIVPNTVTTIGDYAFSGCTGLTSVTIPNSVTSIGNYGFQNCSSLTSITIPNSVISIGETAFQSCTGLTSITIPNSVTSIGQYAFMDTGLTSITIPDSVTSISYGAFYNCSGLTSITIPDSVISIGNNAFWGCRNLTSIISLATTAPTIQSSTFQNVKTGGTLTVPSGSTGYDAWMVIGDYYLGKYSWTKVEQ